MNGENSPSNSYTYSPSDQMFHLGGDLSNPGLSMEDVSQGRLTLSGTSIRDTSTGRIVTNIPLTEEVVVSSVGYVDAFGNPRYSVDISRPRQLSDVNARAFGSSFYSAELTGNLDLPSGVTLALEGASVALGAHGTRLYVTEDPGLNKANYLDVPVDGKTGDPLWEIRPGFRPATPQEAALYGIGSFLLSKYYNELTGLANMGAGEQLGLDGSADQYDIAHYLAGQIAAAFGITTSFEFL